MRGLQRDLAICAPKGERCLHPPPAHVSFKFLKNALHWGTQIKKIILSAWRGGCLKVSPVAGILMVMYVALHAGVGTLGDGDDKMAYKR
eukprot:1338604-Amorphochlora_amoeboformis.AAC.1